jgi:hypothetical protein
VLTFLSPELSSQFIILLLQATRLTGWLLPLVSCLLVLR